MSDPNAPRHFRLRVSYVKQGRLALLSHLELAHALERTVRRAGLPFAVSQGFSPHMKIAFGSALPVGVGSTCEIFDLQLTEYRSADKLLDSLRAASVADLMVQDCRYIEPKAPAASVAFPHSVYEVHFVEPVQGFEVPERIRVLRKRKEKELIVSDYLVGAIELGEDGLSARFTLESKPTGSLRPDLLLEKSGLADAVSSITRISQY